MKINVTAPICDITGAAIEGQTLRSVAVRALLEPLKGDEGMNGERKAQLFAVAMKMHQDDEPDLDIGELKTVRDRVDQAYGPLVVGRVRELLDQKAA